MNGILILTAVLLEASALARRLDLPPLRVCPFRAFGRAGVRLGPVGPGATLLADRWERLADGLPAPLVISAGLCGALDPALVAGDLVVPDTVITLSGERLAVSAPAREGLVARAGGRARPGALVTSVEPIATSAAKAALRAATGASAVDMESAAILRRAATAGWPALVVRGVSDDATRGVPAALSRLVTAEGRLRGGRALALALMRPQTVGPAVALHRGSLRALDAVARALAMLVA